MSVADKLFTCQETPVWTPATFDPNSMSPCLSCTLRLSSLLPGPGSIQPSDIGFTVDENPTTILSINGIDYNLSKAELFIPGLHRLYGKQTVCDAEYVVSFRNTDDAKKTVQFCIPLTIGNGHGTGYFANMGVISRAQPTLSQLISPDTAILTYPGASLYGRTKTTSVPQNICNPISYPITYYVALTPSSITSVDYQRLHSQLSSNHKSGPVPVTEITMTRATSLLTYISSIKLTGAKTEMGAEDGMSTKALKCHRIDPNKDIKNDKVYIGGAPNENTLKKELENAASGNTPDGDDATVKPGDIEKIVSIILGVVISVIICAAIVYFAWKGTFSHYLAGIKLYGAKTPLGAKLVTSIKMPTLCPPPVLPTK
jgi:hypothetical protein